MKRNKQSNNWLLIFSLAMAFITLGFIYKNSRAVEDEQIRYNQELREVTETCGWFAWYLDGTTTKTIADYPPECVVFDRKTFDTRATFHGIKETRDALQILKNDYKLNVLKGK